MPTGYTADVQDGKIMDFRTFALRCARAFGPCIMQPDEPGNDLLKPREESSFYLEALARAQTRLRDLQRMGVSDREVAAQQEYDDAVKRRAEQAERNATEQARYGTEQARYGRMLEMVNAWTPPTPDHMELKRFMQRQLTESMRFDNFAWERPEKQDADEWLAENIAKETANVARYREEVEKERQRVEAANTWIQQLYDSLPRKDTER